MYIYFLKVSATWNCNVFTEIYIKYQLITDMLRLTKTFFK